MPALPDVTSLQQFLKAENLIQRMWQQSWDQFQTIVKELAADLDDDFTTPQKFKTSLSQVQQLGERIARAY